MSVKGSMAVQLSMGSALDVNKHFKQSQISPTNCFLLGGTAFSPFLKLKYADDQSAFFGDIPWIRKAAMASIKERKRKSGSVYLAEIRLRGHLPVSKTFRRKNEAKRWASQAEAEILSGRVLSNGIKNYRTLADAIDRYLQEPLPGSEKTVSEYAWMLRFWKERLGHLNLSEITPANESVATVDFVILLFVRGRE